MINDIGELISPLCFLYIKRIKKRIIKTIMNADFQNYKRVYALETTPETTKQQSRLTSLVTSTFGKQLETSAC